MSEILFSIFSFIVAVGILVTVHEFGHYWVAKKLGVKVLRFSIGFGKPLLRWCKGSDKTEYVIAAIPLGGYVKMLDEREGEVEEDEKYRAFNRQSIGIRSAIVFAGPFFNFLFAIFAYWLMYVVGIQGISPMIGEVIKDSPAYHAGIPEGVTITSVNDVRTPTWEVVTFTGLDKVIAHEALVLEVSDQAGQSRKYTIQPGQTRTVLDEGNLLKGLGILPYRPVVEPVIDKVEQGSAAQRAGIRPGDKLLRADDQELSEWHKVVEYVRQRPGKEIQLEVLRGAETLHLRIRPDLKKVNDNSSIGYIGAAVRIPENPPKDYFAVLQYPPLEALSQAVKKTWQASSLTIRMLGKMLMGEASVENISGPISIAQYAGHTAAVGIGQYLAFLAIVSVSLGILNLLPVPLLDGGHLMYYAVELVKGSPVSEQAQIFGQKIGIALLAMLMTLAIYNDVVRLLT